MVWCERTVNPDLMILCTLQQWLTKHRMVNCIQKRDTIPSSVTLQDICESTSLVYPCRTLTFTGAQRAFDVWGGQKIRVGTFVLFASQSWRDNGRHRVHDHSLHRATAKGGLIIKYLSTIQPFIFLYCSLDPSLKKYPVIKSFMVGY